MRVLAYLVLSHYDEGDTLLQQVMYMLSERVLYEYEGYSLRRYGYGAFL